MAYEELGHDMSQIGGGMMMGHEDLERGKRKGMINNNHGGFR